LKTALSFVVRKTLFIALEELEDVVDDDGLKVDLFLVVQVLGGEFDLRKLSG
jgi:hypothetical protein